MDTPQTDKRQSELTIDEGTRRRTSTWGTPTLIEESFNVVQELDGEAQATIAELIRRFEGALEVAGAYATQQG